MLRSFTSLTVVVSRAPSAASAGSGRGRPAAQANESVVRNWRRLSVIGIRPPPLSPQLLVSPLLPEAVSASRCPARYAALAAGTIGYGCRDASRPGVVPSSGIGGRQQILRTGKFVVPAKAGTQEQATEIPGFLLSRG
jgi:hypothetical protein